MIGFEANLVSMGRFRTVSSVAKELGVHPKTVYRWLDEGKLRRIKPSKNVVRIDEAELRAFLAKDPDDIGEG